MRRFMYQDLAKGWGAWHELYAAKVRQRRLLGNAGARLAKPKLTACFKAWEHSWADDQRAQQALDIEALLERQKAKTARWALHSLFFFSSSVRHDHASPSSASRRRASRVHAASRPS